MAQASDPQQSELINLLVQNLGVGRAHSTPKEEEIRSSHGQFHSTHQNGQNSAPVYHKEVGGQRRQLRESGEGDFNPFGTPYFQSLATPAEPPARDQEWQEYLKMMNLGGTVSTEGVTMGRDPSYPSGDTHFVPNMVPTPSPYPPSFPGPYYPPTYSHAVYPSPGYSTYAPSYSSYSSAYSPFLSSETVSSEPPSQLYAPPFGVSSSEELSPPLLHSFETVPHSSTSPSTSLGQGVEETSPAVEKETEKEPSEEPKETSASPSPVGSQSPTMDPGNSVGSSSGNTSAKSRSWASIAITAKTSPESSPASELKVSPPVKSGGEPKAKVSGTPPNGVAKKDKSHPNTYGPAVDPKLVLKYPLLAGVNATTIDCTPSFARFFVIKSYSEDDIHKSIKYNIWASTDSGNRRLDGAFKESASRGPIYLFFSVNASGQFCGLAQMVSPLDYNTKSNVWAQDKWNGQFKVKWLLIKDIPNAHLRHIRLTNNENKPVTNSRDTQEILFEPGKELLRLFLNFKSKNSLLEDFSFYDKRQEEMEEKKNSVDDKKNVDN